MADQTGRTEAPMILVKIERTGTRATGQKFMRECHGQQGRNMVSFGGNGAR